MNRENQKAFVPIVLLFIIFNGIILIFKTFLEAHGFDREFLLWANLFLLLISVGGFLLQRKGLQSPNPQAFVRGMYASMMFKMFITIIVVLVYVFLFRTKINKPGIFAAMGMYVVYTVVEVAALMKVARTKKNA
jgi:FtsH-binding integral membrane protein